MPFGSISKYLLIVIDSQSFFVFGYRHVLNKYMLKTNKMDCIWVDYLPNNAIKCWRCTYFRWLFQVNPTVVYSKRFPHYLSKCLHRQIHLSNLWPLQIHFHVLICRQRILYMKYLLLAAPQLSCWWLKFETK